MRKRPIIKVLNYRQMRARKTNAGWILVDTDYIRFHHIVSVDDCGRWLRTTDGTLQLIPGNQKNRVIRELEIFKP